MRTLWPDRQSKVYLTFPYNLVDLAENLRFGNTGQALLPGKALLNGINILNFKYEDDLKI
jgi:hypothetical protein